MILVPPQARPALLRARDGVVLVRQADHAAVSAHLATQWRRPTAFTNELWQGLIDATQHHDDGWIDEDARPEIDPNGVPRHFLNMPLQTHLEIWRRSIGMALDRSPLVGLLVARQARWLYTPREPSKGDQDRANKQRSEYEQRLLQDFLHETDREVTRIESDLSAQHTSELLDLARGLLSFLDALSLMMLGAIPMRHWPEILTMGDSTNEVSVRTAVSSEHGQDYRTISVDPWPFAPDRVRSQVSASYVGAASFESAEELREELANAPAHRIFWELSSPP